MSRLSVVVPTLGRPILTQTIRSVMETRGAEGLELIVFGRILNASVKEDVLSLVREYPQIRYEDVAFEYGDLSRKKNRGLEESRSDIVVFIDDDLLVPRDWAEKIVAPFSDPDVGMVCGPSLMPDDLPRMARLSGLALASGAAGFVARRYRRESGGPGMQIGPRPLDATWPAGRVFLSQSEGSIRPSFRERICWLRSTC